MPGVEVVFMGHYSMISIGIISARGNDKQKIIFRSNDTTGWSDPNTTAGGWQGIAFDDYSQPSLTTPTFEYCVFKDMKRYQSFGLFGSSTPLMYINECEFYHNMTDGKLISLSNNLSTVVSKLKFTNCSIHDNIAGIIMFTLYSDSIHVQNNKFYNNTTTSGFGIFANASMNSMSDNFMLFDNNELYQNTTSQLGGGIVNCTQGGNSRISNNYIHHNTTQKNGAIFLQSKSSLVENNLVINNNQVLNGSFCGINDGGSGIQLLGQNLDAAVSGRNIHIVRNNIVANNHSALTGAGIWVQHCEAKIINNTFINNTSEGLGAAVRGWGLFCKLRMYNNIIFGNKILNALTDTIYNNFYCMANLLELSNNLIDYHLSPSFMPQNVQGLFNNMYDHTLSLQSPTTGAGITYDATNSDFNLNANALNCINRGNNSISDFGATDFYGNPRVVGGSIDIGAAEFQSTTTHIRNTAAGENIQVFPSPSNGAVTIKHQGGQAINEISLMDLSGRVLHNFKIKSGHEYTIQIGQYPDATYLLAIATGKQTIYKKIMLKK